MAKEIKIFPVQQFTIDQIRMIRLDFGITANELSKKVSPSESAGFIAVIESIKSPAFYTDHNLNIIANEFSKYAEKIQRGLDTVEGNVIQIKTSYTIFDFYPKEPLSDVPQIKTKIDIPAEVGPTGTLNAILESKDFFDHQRTIKEITDYCNSFYNKDWKSTNFTSPLEYAVKKGKLKRVELPDGGVKYVVA